MSVPNFSTGLSNGVRTPYTAQFMRMLLPIVSDSYNFGARWAAAKTLFADITRANLGSVVCEMMKYTNPSTLRTYPKYIVAAEVPQNGGIL